MKCPNCDFIDRDEAFGEPATCPKCSAVYEKALRVKELRDQVEMEKTAKNQPRPIKVPQKKQAPVAAVKKVKQVKERHEVVITDIDIPFTSMIVLIFKIMLASIPAAIMSAILIFIAAMTIPIFSLFLSSLK